MAINITEDALNASLNLNIEPQIVFEIDGISTIFTTTTVGRVALYGDEIFYGDAGLTYGGLVPFPDQKEYISFDAGTTTQIRQTLNIDKGSGESITSMQIALIDKDGDITELLKPDDSVSPTFDLMGRKCKVWFGFQGTAFKEDFIVIFRGNIDDISSGAGIVTFNVISPDNKKRSEIFTKAETDLTAGITSGATVLPVTATGDFFFPVTGPDLTIDETVKFYVRIDDEIIRYEGGTGTEFNTATRGELGTVAAVHDIGATVESFYRLTGNVITDIALKVMLSGLNGPYLEAQEIENFVRVIPSELVANSIFFQDLDVVFEHNVTVGDFVTTTGASNGANNVTLSPITEIVKTDNGSYIVIGSESFIEEIGTAAVIDIRSQFDTLGEGLSMVPDEVDIAEHIRIFRTFLASFPMDFFLKDTINGKDFLSDEVYLPAGAFSIPRKARASLGFHLPGVIPGTLIKTLSSTNVSNAANLVIKRSTSKNFFNSVVFKFEELALEDKFIRGTIVPSTDSFERIPVGNKPLNIESTGLRESLGGVSLATTVSNRRLKKYQFGAEFIKSVIPNFKTGFDIEIADALLFDMTSLKISDINTGTRVGESRLFEVDNKQLDLRTGRVTLNIVDTNFDKDARFGLISPASFIKSATSDIVFLIEPSFNTDRFGNNEFRKWENFLGASVVIRSVDFVTSDTGILLSNDGNEFTLEASLAFTPTAGMVMEFDKYDNQPDTVKALFTFMSDVTFADGQIQYQMI